MEVVTITWIACAVVAMTLAMVCGVVWLIERRDLANLMLCIPGVATAASAVGELGMMHSATPAEYVGWLRFYFVPVCVALVSQLLFVHYYLGTGRSWLMWAVIVARSGMVLVNFLVRPNFNFSSVVSFRQFRYSAIRCRRSALPCPAIGNGLRRRASFCGWPISSMP